MATKEAVFERKQPKLTFSQWPRREEGSRLVDRCEPFHSPKFGFSKSDSFFTVGSCFARNIEEYLSRAGVPVRSLDLDFPREELKPNSRKNDLLVKYTPGSIYQELTAAFEGDLSPERYMVQSDRSAGVFDVNLPFDYPTVPMERAVERRGQIRNLFRQIQTTDVFVLTLGLIEHWYDNKLQIYINSRPGPRLEKQYPGRFECRRLPFNQNLRLVERSLDLIRSVNSNIRIVITTSPVPLGRTFSEYEDVIVANSYSKSLLRTVAQEVSEGRDYVDYFPSYEIVTHSPAAKAWENDLRHVRDSMVGEIMSRFFAEYFPAEQARSAQSVSEDYAKGLRLLDDNKGEEAYSILRALETQFPNDQAFMYALCRAAILANRADEAHRLSRILMERFPGEWAHILKARADLMNKDFASALIHIEEAKKHPRTKFQASGWEMEAGRLSGNPAIELSGAFAAAKALQDEPTAANKKPWVHKRMVAVLKKQGIADVMKAISRAPI